MVGKIKSPNVPSVLLLNGEVPAEVIELSKSFNICCTFVPLELVKLSKTPISVAPEFEAVVPVVSRLSPPIENVPLTLKFPSTPMTDCSVGFKEIFA